MNGPIIGLALLLASEAGAANKRRVKTKSREAAVQSVRTAPASLPAAEPARVVAPVVTPAPVTTPDSVPLVAPASPTLAAPTQTAPAPEQKPTPIGLGAALKGGVLVPTNKLVTSATIGGEIRERFPFLHRVLALSVDFDYFEPRLSAGGSSPTVSGAYTYRVSARALALGVDVLAFLPLDWLVDLYGGVGYGAFFYDLTSTAFGAKQSELQLRHGLRVRAGVLWPFWRPLYLGAEVLYQYAAFDFLITGPSNAGTIVATLFVGFEL